MEIQEMFKVENKEFAIRSSKTRCEYCSEILANFEAMMFGTHCSACHYTNQVSVVTDRIKSNERKTEMISYNEKYAQCGSCNRLFIVDKYAGGYCSYCQRHIG